MSEMLIRVFDQSFVQIAKDYPASFNEKLAEALATVMKAKDHFLTG